MRVEEYVSENNNVRAIDAYVNTVDIQGLGFAHGEGIIKAGRA
jgi:hypothetical protein